MSVWTAYLVLISTGAMICLIVCILDIKEKICCPLTITISSLSILSIFCINLVQFASDIDTLSVLSAIGMLLYLTCKQWQWYFVFWRVRNSGLMPWLSRNNTKASIAMIVLTVFVCIAGAVTALCFVLLDNSSHLFNVLLCTYLMLGEFTFSVAISVVFYDKLTVIIGNISNQMEASENNRYNAILQRQLIAFALQILVSLSFYLVFVISFDNSINTIYRYWIVGESGFSTIYYLYLFHNRRMSKFAACNSNDATKTSSNTQIINIVKKALFIDSVPTNATVSKSPKASIEKQHVQNTELAKMNDECKESESGSNPSILIISDTVSDTQPQNSPKKNNKVSPVKDTQEFEKVMAKRARIVHNSGSLKEMQVMEEYFLDGVDTCEKEQKESVTSELSALPQIIQTRTPKNMSASPSKSKHFRRNSLKSKHFEQVLLGNSIDQQVGSRFSISESNSPTNLSSSLRKESLNSITNESPYKRQPIILPI